MILLKYAFQLDPGDPADLRAQFEALGRITSGLPLQRLAFPLGYSKLAAVRQAVLRDLRLG